MWLRKYLYYVVCPRSSKFADCFPAMLQHELAIENRRLRRHGKPPIKAPLVEIKMIASRLIGAISASLGPTEETTASVTLTDPESGIVVGTAICIGLASAMPQCTCAAAPERTPSIHLRRRAWHPAAAGVSANRAGRQAVWTNGSSPLRGRRSLACCET